MRRSKQAFLTGNSKQSHGNEYRAEADRRHPGCRRNAGEIGGDRRLFRDIIGFFLEDAPPLLGELHDAVGRRTLEPFVRPLTHSKVSQRGVAASALPKQRSGLSTPAKPVTSRRSIPW